MNQLPASEPSTPTPQRIHDIVGIGIGPFNLGLACLSDPIAELDSVFLDARESFAWHPGMMIDGATIQVPFLADLVSLADPTSPLSFLNFLKQNNRLYPFYIRESFYPLRAEFDNYARWAADQLDTLRWGRRVTEVHRVTSTELAGADHEELYRVTAETSAGTEHYLTRNLVLGIGTAPHLPQTLVDTGGPVLHSADYLDSRTELLERDRITIIGSGQSAAEIYRDLLDRIDTSRQRLDWITRSPRFFPMEYTKLTLELTSPEYTDHFHRLPADRRAQIGREQRSLYKGISEDLVNDIYDTLYRLNVNGEVPTTLLTDSALEHSHWDGTEFTLDLHHASQDEAYRRHCDIIVAATGYAPRTPQFLAPISDRLDFDELGRPAVARDYSIDAGRGHVFVQNAEEHTHGLTAPDLGFGAWRNSAILASILGHEPYPIEQRIAFQQFGPVPDEPTAASNRRESVA